MDDAQERFRQRLQQNCQPELQKFTSCFSTPDCSLQPKNEPGCSTAGRELRVCAMNVFCPTQMINVANACSLDPSSEDCKNERRNLRTCQEFFGLPT